MSFLGEEGKREGNNKINVPKLPQNYQKGGKNRREKNNKSAKHLKFV